MKRDIEDVLRGVGVIRPADHPKLARRLDRLRGKRELLSPLPGVLWHPEAAGTFEAAVLAGQLWAGPDAVLTGRAAARMTFWKDAPVESYPFAIPRRRTVRHGAWRLGFRVIPPEYIWRRGPIVFTAPALTAVDLADGDDGGDVIDRALRSRQVTLDHLRAALRAQPTRRGNGTRAAVLHDSRDSPWSEGERGLHRLLRKKRITGWETNAWIPICGEDYFVDVLFRRRRLIVEFDGWEFHRDREAFENDRRRRNELELAGYRVLNFTWRQLTEDPEWVIDCIRRALDGRRS